MPCAFLPSNTYRITVKTADFIFVPADPVDIRLLVTVIRLAAAEQISEPVDDFFEHVFFRDMQADPDGFVTVRAENPTLGIAAEICYEQKNLPCFVQWKSMRSGDYALGLEPSNTILRGRAAEHEAGALPTLPGFGRAEFRLKFSFSGLEK